MAFYLKYRPQKVADIDLTDAREALTRVLGSDPFPHAVLLTGPRGIGKTSAARIIAKSLNCLVKKSGQINPCNRCDSCLSINKGNFLDVLEIDAASNRGIDDIRQLKEGIGLAPVKGKQKIYIIDEVHMLTNEAFNALLKTLEEPPKKVVFLLCTTNPEKIPQTVLSRCLRINFTKASNKEVLRALRRVIKKEKLIIENDQVLTIIADSVDGSFRDAQKILEELSFGKSKITINEATKIVGQKTSFKPGRLLIFLSGNDLLSALKEINRLEADGVDWLFYIKILLEEIRKMLHGAWGLVGGQENDFSPNQLILWAENFSWAAKKVKNSPLPVLAMELAISRSIKDSPSEDFRKTSKKQPKVRKKIFKKGKDQPAMTDQQWQMLLAKIKPKNHSLEAFLKAAQPVSLKEDRLTLGVNYQFHKECLEKEANRRIVELVAGEILNRPISLFYCLNKKPSRKVLAKSKKKVLVDNSGHNSVYNMAKKIFGGDDND